ncbi:hypothetical protein ACFWQC_11160 [Nocardioides sp. NPDC058538]
MPDRPLGQPHRRPDERPAHLLSRGEKGDLWLNAVLVVIALAALVLATRW